MSQVDVFKLRIFTADHYLSRPVTGLDQLFSQFRGTETVRVPVIRIFGATEFGQKACLHVHQVYPYLSVPYDEVVNDDGTDVMEQLHKLASELEAKLKQDTNRNGEFLVQFIHDIEQFRAKPIYGYHQHNKRFLRMKLYNPSTVSKVAEFLSSGLIMHKTIQPFEAHLTFILQFFIDFNLYGMDFINVKNVSFRRSPNINMRTSGIEPMTSCEVECDVLASGIMNCNVESTGQRIPGLQSIWNDVSNRHPNLNCLRAPQSQEPQEIPVYDAEQYHLNKLYSMIGNLKVQETSKAIESRTQSACNSHSAFVNLIADCINRQDEDKDDDSLISNEMSQKLENIVTGPKYLSDDEISSDSTEVEDDEQAIESASSEKSEGKDAETQTEANLENEVGEEIWGDVNWEEENTEDNIDAVCDCESDECCDQCCDRRSDQCECDCEHCEVDSHRKIPQIDGAYDDSDEEEADMRYVDDSNDSDYDVTSESKKGKKAKKSKPKRKKPPKKSPKKSVEKKKETFTINDLLSSKAFDTDDEDDLISKKPETSKPAASSNFSFNSLTSSSKFDSLFNDSSSSSPSSPRTSKRTANKSKNEATLTLSDYLTNKFTKPNDDTKAGRISPVEALFTDSDDSSKNDKSVPLSTLSFSLRHSLNPNAQNKKLKKHSPPKVTRASRAKKNASGIKTPEVSEDSEEEVREIIAKPGPKSIKRKKLLNEIKNSTDSNDSLSYDGKNEIKDVSTNNRSNLNPKKRVMFESLNGNDEDHFYKTVNFNFLKIYKNDIEDENVFNKIGCEFLKIDQLEDYEISDQITDYENEFEYWEIEKKNCQAEQISMASLKVQKALMNRSKGAVKEFYTNEISPDKPEVAKSNEIEQRPSRRGRVASELNFIEDTGKATKGRLRSAAVKRKKEREVVPVFENKTRSKRQTAVRGSAKFAQPVRNAAKKAVKYVPQKVIPFVQSDLVSLTNLTGEKKLNYLQSLCTNFTVDVEQVDDELIQRWLNASSNFSPYLFNDVYYNDYTGYLSDDDSPIAKDVRLVMRNLVNDTVVIQQILDDLVDKVEQDIIHEMYVNNEFPPYVDEDEDEAPVEMPDEGGIAASDNEYENEYYDSPYKDDSPYGVEESEEEDRENKSQLNGERVDEANDNSFLENEQNDNQSSELNERDFGHQTDDLKNVGIQADDSDEEAEISKSHPSDDHRDEETSELGSPKNQNDYLAKEPEMSSASSTEEDDDQTPEFEVPPSSSYSVYQSNIPEAGYQPPFWDPRFQSSATFNAQLHDPQMQQQFINMQPPSASPHIPASQPTLSVNNTFQQQQQWQQYPAEQFSQERGNVQQQDYSNSFSNYYYEHHNFPQLDGTVDDDEFESTVRSKLASAKRKSSSEGEEPMSEEMEFAKRYCKSIFGVDVNVDESIPEVVWQKIGNENLTIHRLTDAVFLFQNATENSSSSGRSSSSCIEMFYPTDVSCFYKTSLKGAEKLKSLLSFCKPVFVNICQDDVLQYYKRKNLTSLDINLTSFSSQNFVIFKENDIKESIGSQKCPSQSLSICSSKNDFEENGVFSFYQQSPFHSFANCNDNLLGQELINESVIKSSKDSDSRRDETSQTGGIQSDNEVSTNTIEALILLEENDHNKSIAKKELARRFDSIIEGPTPDNTFDFEVSSINSNFHLNSSSEDEFQFLTIMSLEVQASSRRDLIPDPSFDNIQAIFFSFYRDYPSERDKKFQTNGIIIVEHSPQDFGCDINSLSNKINSCSTLANDLLMERVLSEDELLMKLVEIVRKFDPDIFLGYEIESSSWGYVLKRAEVLNINIFDSLTRINSELETNYFHWKSEHLNFPGRITLNLWRILRHEVNLNVYTYENVHYHVLHERIPRYENSELTQWFGGGNKLSRWRVIEYFLIRTQGNLKILSKLDLISRTSELARLFGIQFTEVFTRGSQFRVESMMLRLSKQHNFIALSPSPKQRSRMRSPEAFPLILEPESKFYSDPVAVLDFQSLYPSMIIAYNYCYSTCLGKLDTICSDEKISFGCHYLDVSKKTIDKYQDHIHIAPNGVAFLKSEIQKGILPQMLEDILDTRIMVKNAMKELGKKKIDDSRFVKQLDSRQLGLKLIANVTYGYTNANFSGRMPCIEVADAIVSKGRETLERAIKLVNKEKKWNARVIYGDTDSLFVLFPGDCKEEAFRKSREIVEAVTANNPKPVKLKLEKIYMPCVLQTKKRYVGFKYESEDQREPEFEAKGIETVRRDTCPAASKILEKSLRILFKTQDVREVKNYVQRQFQKMLSGRISMLNDFIFCREYRGLESYQEHSYVPALEIAKKRLSKDPRSEPKRSERVPYVVVNGPPNLPIIKLVKEPIQLIKNPNLKINAIYYIERVIIPPLNRVYNLIGEDVMKWYHEAPKYKSYLKGKCLAIADRPKTITQYFESRNCVVCSEQTDNHLCKKCAANKQNSAFEICESIRDTQLKFQAINNICKSCTGSPDNDPKCASLDCPILFRYTQTKIDMINIKYLNEVLDWLKCK